MARPVSTHHMVTVHRQPTVTADDVSVLLRGKPAYTGAPTADQTVSAEVS
jgi:hypothetical protein